jgi:hypothetical protein
MDSCCSRYRGELYIDWNNSQEVSDKNLSIAARVSAADRKFHEGEIHPFDVEHSGYRDYAT